MSKAASRARAIMDTRDRDSSMYSRMAIRLLEDLRSAREQEHEQRWISRLRKEEEERIARAALAVSVDLESSCSFVIPTVIEVSEGARSTKQRMPTQRERAELLEEVENRREEGVEVQLDEVTPCDKVASLNDERVQKRYRRRSRRRSSRRKEEGDDEKDRGALFCGGDALDTLCVGAYDACDCREFKDDFVDECVYAQESLYADPDEQKEMSMLLPSSSYGRDLYSSRTRRRG